MVNSGLRMVNQLNGMPRKDQRAGARRPGEQQQGTKKDGALGTYPNSSFFGCTKTGMADMKRPHHMEISPA